MARSIVRSGESVVLVTACTAPEPKAGASFFPLTVDYREYTYSAGRFPGGFIKREGRPTEKEILTSRLIDRPIRPLFPEGYSHETQIIAMVLSADPERDPSTLAIVGAGAALAISDIPFHHVLGAVRVGMVDGKYVANPTYEETKRVEAQHRRRRHRRRHRDGGSRRAAGLRSGSARRHRVRPRLLQEDRRGHPASWWRRPARPKREFAAEPINQALYDQIAKSVRAELTDALNTKKYEKLESYARVDAAARTKPSTTLAEEQKAEAQEAVRAR